MNNIAIVRYSYEICGYYTRVKCEESVYDKDVKVYIVDITNNHLLKVKKCGNLFDKKNGGEELINSIEKYRLSLYTKGGQIFNIAFLEDEFGHGFHCEILSNGDIFVEWNRDISTTIPKEVIDDICGDLGLTIKLVDLDRYVPPENDEWYNYRYAGNIPCGTFHELSIKSPAYCEYNTNEVLSTASKLPIAEFDITNAEMVYYVMIEVKYNYCSVYKDRIVTGKSSFTIGFDFDDEDGYKEKSELHIIKIYLHNRISSASRLKFGKFICEDKRRRVYFQTPANIFEKMLYEVKHYYFPSKFFRSGDGGNKKEFEEWDYIPTYLKYKL